MRAILTYHSIDHSGSLISVTPDTFRAHIAWLQREQVPVVSLAALMALDDRSDAVALTFDDALVSVAADAAPVLADHRLPATIFVVSGHVGTDNRWNGAVDRGVPVQRVLGWKALDRLRDQGFTIGAHTRHHRHLRHCTDTELADEMGGSAADIAAALDLRPDSFAYPYGDVDDRVAAAAAREFTSCCTTEFRAVDPTARADLIPRLDAWYFRDARRMPRWSSRHFRRQIAARHALRRLRRVFH